MSRRRFAVLAMLAIVTSTLGAVDTPPILSAVISDGARLRQHWDASVYGRLWADPVLAPMRAKLNPLLANLEETNGLNPFTVLSAFNQASFSLSDISARNFWQESMRLTLQVDLGDQAATVMKTLRAQAEPETVAGASEALALDEEGTLLARFFSILVLHSAKAGAPKPTAIAATEHDLTLRFDFAPLASAIREGFAKEPADKQAMGAIAIPLISRFLVAGEGWVDVVEAGFRSRFAVTDVLPWLVPVDLGLCAKLPANAYSVAAIGFDGQVLWNELHHPLLALIGHDRGLDEAAVLAEADKALAEVGLTLTAKELCTGLRGTFLVVTTPGSPFPSYTVAIPRSPVVDALITLACQQIQAELPAAGQMSMLTIPNLPVAISLIAERSHWVVTSDQSLAATWGQTDGGWNGSPLGKLAAAKVGKDACALMISDTAAELRQYMGYVTLALNNVPGLDNKEKQSLLRGLGRLVAMAGLGHEVLRRAGGQLISEGESLFGGGSSSTAVIAVIAAIAIPNLLESRVAANEAAAATSLKAGVFPAQIQFQAGGYHDRDQNGIGDFGFFAEMAGGPIPGQKQELKLTLLPERWNAVTPEINGYCFAIFLPDGKGGALSADNDRPVVDPLPGQGPEINFVAYAWPADDTKGRRLFAITAQGSVYASPPVKHASAPKWNDLFGGEGKGWKDIPVWTLYRR